MRYPPIRASLPVTLLLLAACGDGASPPGGSDSGRGSSPCASDRDCDDGIYCNGVERCAPSRSDANDNGCAPGPTPCQVDQECVETSLRCETVCARTHDADGDGRDALECGGDDCDDSDPLRFPGNTEICDVDDRDEDCDPGTTGFRDLDGDGVSSADCCNTQNDGSSLCGRDCDDMAPGTHPSVPEVCDGIDNDCDGELDEGVFRVLHADTDADGFGDATLPVEAECGTDMPGFVDNGLDCDDSTADVRPGAPEICDGRDSNCDGLLEIDADGDGHLPAQATCAGGPLPLDDCNDVDGTIFPGAPEACDGFDNDCDGMRDERPDADLACSIRGVDLGYCLDRSCVVVRCETGFGDCDGFPENGCEADLTATAAHCGSCGNGCPLGEACVDGLCGRPRVVAVAPGSSHTCAALDSGRVACWGRNDYGQLGDGTTVRRTTATLTQGIAGAVGIEAGFRHSCARLSSGDVFCWGGDGYGSIGDETLEPSLVPVPVSAVADVEELSGHFKWQCARLGDGTVQCWGANTAEIDRPPSDMGLSGVAQFSASTYHHCFVTDSGSTQCAGINLGGALGDGVSDHGTQCFGELPEPPPSVILADCSSTPVTVLAPIPFEAVDVGDFHTCARGGTRAYCWGTNSNRRCGIDDTSNQYAPVLALDRAAAGATITDVSAGSGASCAVSSDGALHCWGNNAFTGTGATSGSTLATAITLPGPASDVEMGPSHACVIHSNGALSCWGFNFSGALGDRTTTRRYTPTRVTGFDPVFGVAAGDTMACARLASGEVHCWGDADPFPAAVTGVANAVTISAAGHACAVLTDGSLTCWGDNDAGQLGRGTVGGAGAPMVVALPMAVRSVSTHGDSTCAVLADGSVWCWGENTEGMLGDGTTEDRASPVEVEGLPAEAIVVGGGSAHACALLRSGNVYCWGAGGDGRLGDGRAVSSAAPVRVENLGDVAALSVGGAHACAVRASGIVACWGAGQRGQLGAGAAVTTAPSPVRVVGLSDITELAAGSDHTCALRADGIVYCWGDNTVGALGDGTTEARSTPGEVPGLIARSIGAGHWLSCAVGVDHGALCWGNHLAGQVGDGTPPCNAQCVVVSGGVPVCTYDCTQLSPTPVLGL